MSVSHRVTIAPLRVARFDSSMSVRVVYGVGFRFVCSCGARGKVRRRYATARDDGREHRAEPG